jgi:hypothetical protein
MTLAAGRSRYWRLPLFAASILAAAFLVLGVSDPTALGLLPPILLIALMAARPHPGVELIVRLAARRPRRPAAARARQPRPARRVRCRRRSFLSSLGERAPPALAGCG